MFRSVLKVLLVVLELALVAAAVFGGVQLLRDPSGLLLQMPAARFLPPDSVFQDWTVPALLLLVTNGVFPLVVLVGALNHRPWADLGHVAVGLVLTGWMTVQAGLVGFGAPIQVVFLSLGLFIFALGALRVAVTPDGQPRSGVRSA